MRMISALVSAFLLVPVLASPGEAQTTAPASADVARAPATNAAGVAYLTGRRIHTAGGRTAGVPVPASHAGSLSLLGHSPRGWVVADFAPARPRVLVFRPGGRARTVTSGPEDGGPGSISFHLSPDGKRVLRWRFDPYRGHATVVRVDGSVVASRSFADGGPIEFDGRHVVVSERSKLWDVDAGTTTRLAPGFGSFADFGADLLITSRDFAERAHAVRLSDPATERWSVDARYEAQAVSPDERFLAGTRRGRIEVRDLGTGRRTATIEVPGTGLLVVDWSQSDGPLVKAYRGQRAAREKALFRCDVDGGCTQVTPWTGVGRSLSVGDGIHYDDSHDRDYS